MCSSDLCSSLVSLLGNVGQADYAYANAFLDELAVTRERRRHAGGQHGKTLSIAWPAWGGGGMAADITAAADPAGPVLGVEEGLAALRDALTFAGPRLALVKGDPAHVRARAARGPAFGTRPRSLTTPRRPR